MKKKWLILAAIWIPCLAWAAGSWVLYNNGTWYNETTGQTMMLGASTYPPGVNTFTPSPTFVPASSWTPTQTLSPTVTPTGSWTPVPTFTETPLATIGFLVYPDYHSNEPENLTQIYLHQENLLFSDNPLGWGLPNPTWEWGLGTHGGLGLIAYSDNNQSEILEGQGSINFAVEQNSDLFTMENGVMDFQGQGIQQLAAISYRGPSLSGYMQPGAITLVNGAATQVNPNLPAIQGTPFVAYCSPVSYIGTPGPMPVGSVTGTGSGAGQTVIFKGYSTDDSIYMPIYQGYYGNYP